MKNTQKQLEITVTKGYLCKTFYSGRLYFYTDADVINRKLLFLNHIREWEATYEGQHVLLSGYNDLPGYVYKVVKLNINGRPYFI